jgi:hypothetical protein
MSSGYYYEGGDLVYIDLNPLTVDAFPALWQQLLIKGRDYAMPVRYSPNTAYLAWELRAPIRALTSLDDALQRIHPASEDGDGGIEQLIARSLKWVRWEEHHDPNLKKPGPAMSIVVLDSPATRGGEDIRADQLDDWPALREVNYQEGVTGTRFQLTNGAGRNRWATVLCCVERFDGTIDSMTDVRYTEMRVTVRSGGRGVVSSWWNV